MKTSEGLVSSTTNWIRVTTSHASPGLSWDAMLKMTQVRLELITDVDMFQFIEKGLRCGVSNITHMGRYGKANNKYMKEYDKDELTKYIMYLDANNLYGWAMSQYLPTGAFRWKHVGKGSRKDVEKWMIKLAECKDDSDKGIILEVDLEYPAELHDEHNDFPLAPEKLLIEDNMLSKYSRNIMKEFNISSGKVSKLVTSLNNKVKYVVHYRTLQFYLSLGLRVSKVHRVLEFNQEPWLSKYINYNTIKRTAAKIAFEKDFFKLMNNSVFGKTMENIRKRVDVRLVTTKEQLLELTSKPTFISSKEFNKNLAAVHKIKESLLFNRPAYVGMCILDLLDIPQNIRNTLTVDMVTS